MPARRGLHNLITIAEDERALKERFPVWPESVFTTELLDLLLSDNLAIDSPRAKQLLETGLVSERSGTLVPAIPVYEDEREALRSLKEFGQDAAERLAPFINHLRTSWPRVGEDLPSWQDVAHNLVMGFLLCVCGSKLLLCATSSKSAVMLSREPSRLPGVWFSSVRLLPDLAVVDTVGATYPSSDLLSHLLRQQDVIDTLASVDPKGQLIVYGDKTLSLLRRLSALKETSPGPWLPNDYWLRWPVITQETLHRVQKPLELACRALNLVIRELLEEMATLDLPGGFHRTDLALMGLMDLAGALLSSWLKAGLLPPISTPWLDDWQMPDAQGSLQSELLKALAR